MSLARVPCFCHRDPFCSEAPRPYDEARTFLDCHFWQSLSKAIGWENDPMYDDQTKVSREQQAVDHNKIASVRLWHRFIDHLASGKDAASFFAHIN